MHSPNQFKVNEAWIVFRLNDAPISTERDGDFNVLTIMDAASRFILGTEFVPVSSIEASQLESRRLLKAARSHKAQLPRKLLLPDVLVADTLKKEAESLGISVIRVPEEDLSVFVEEAREGFREHVGGGRTQ